MLSGCRGGGGGDRQDEEGGERDGPIFHRQNSLSSETDARASPWLDSWNSQRFAERASGSWRRCRLSSGPRQPLSLRRALRRAPALDGQRVKNACRTAPVSPRVFAPILAGIATGVGSREGATNELFAGPLMGATADVRERVERRSVPNAQSASGVRERNATRLRERTDAVGYLDRAVDLGPASCSSQGRGERFPASAGQGAKVGARPPSPGGRPTMLHVSAPYVPETHAGKGIQVSAAMRKTP
jgi:hypothetical protein